MVYRKLSDLTPYEAAGHFDVSTLRVHSADTTGAEQIIMGMSHFLPNGGSKPAPVKPGMELIYFCTAGQIKVTVGEAQDETYILTPGDSILFKAGDIRSILNETKMPATILVIMAKK